MEQQSLNKFWCGMLALYPNVAKLALKVLLPFATTYLCESGFSALVVLKTEKLNRLNVEDDMRLALSATKPRITELVEAMQSHPSHKHFRGVFCLFVLNYHLVKTLFFGGFVLMVAVGCE